MPKVNMLILKPLAAILTLTVLTVGTSVSAGDLRLRCEADSLAEDASMDGKFETDGTRDKFSASFEAAPGGSFVAGDKLDVAVQMSVVGQITLEALPDTGELVGDLNFDTTAGDADADSPFPAGFPAVGAGTRVDVGALACVLN
jgi:hypothetical protein